MASTPIRIEPGHPGHVAHQATELAQVALTGGVQHRTRAEEQQAFENAWFSMWYSAGGQCQRRQAFMP